MLAAERKFPPRCPNCRRLLADSGRLHCPATNNHCPWIRCTCGKIIDQEKP